MKFHWINFSKSTFVVYLHNWLQRFLFNTCKDLSLQFNVDGIKLFSSTSKTLWPIKCRIVHPLLSYPIVVGYFMVVTSLHQLENIYETLFAILMTACLSHAAAMNQSEMQQLWFSYGDIMLMYNVHILEHLDLDIETFGCLDCSSTFPFESDIDESSCYDVVHSTYVQGSEIY
jgi:hypothetical protein